MPRVYTIHKPTHKWFGPNGTPALAIGQLRGGILVLNRFDESGRLVEKSWTAGAAHDLTGYGEGVPTHDVRQVSDMQGAWRYVFGSSCVPFPAYCEKHQPGS